MRPLARLILALALPLLLASCRDDSESTGHHVQALTGALAVQVDFNGYVGRICGGPVDECGIEGGAKTLDLAAGPNDLWTYGSYSSADWSTYFIGVVTVTAEGVGSLDGEASKYFTLTKTGPRQAVLKVQAALKPITLDRNGYQGCIKLGDDYNVPLVDGKETFKVFAGRYSDVSELCAGLQPQDAFVLMNANGQVTVPNASSFPAITVSGSTVTLNSSPITFDFSGYQEQFIPRGADVTVNGQPTPDSTSIYPFPLLKKWIYRLQFFHSVSSGAPASDYGASFVDHGLTTTSTGQATLTGDAGKYLLLKNASTVAPRLGYARILRGAFTGDICAESLFDFSSPIACAPASGDLVMSLIVDRAYFFGPQGAKLFVKADGTCSVSTIKVAGTSLSVKCSLTRPADTVAPPPPGSLTATAKTTSRIDLAWARGRGFAIETSFHVERSVDDPNHFGEIGTTGAGVLAFSDTTGLSKGHTYWYRVRAYNAVGPSAEYSSSASASLLVPLAPDGLKAAATGATSVSLAWTDLATDETGYRVLRATNGGSFSIIKDGLPADTQAFADGAALANASNKYQVVAFNALGPSDPSNTAEAILKVPAAPTQLHGEALSATRVQLSWSPGSTDETGFEIEVFDAATAKFKKTGTTGAAVVSFSQTVASGAQPKYRVRAVNLSGPSTYSNETTVTAGAPTAPAAVTAVLAGPRRVDVGWQDKSNNERLFRVQRSADSAFPAGATVSADRPANSTAFSDTDLDPGIYYYRVQAINGVSTATSSPPVQAVLMPPLAPTHLKALVVSTTRIDLTWADCQNETGYRIERQTNGGAWTRLTGVPTSTPNLAANAVSFSNTGLVTTSGYRYRVIAFNPVGESVPPAETDAENKPGLPAAPANLKAIVITSTRVDLSWQDVATNENDYVLTWLEGTTTKTLTLPANTQAASIGLLPTSAPIKLTAATTYRFNVAAHNGVGSASASVTTRTSAPSAAPRTLVATALSGSQIRLDWDDTYNNETGFRVERSLDGSTNWIELPLDVTRQPAAGQNVKTFTDENLEATTKYFYAVRAWNALGSGKVSVTFAITLGYCINAPGRPCDDHNACTTEDLCGGDGICHGGKLLSCDDGNDCTADSCQSPGGTCRHDPVAAAAACDDHEPCTQTSTCDGAGHCKGGALITCGDDGRPCTDEICVPGQGCVSQPRSTCDNTGPCLPILPGDPGAGDGHLLPGGGFGGPALQCEQVFPIFVDATDLGPGQMTVDSNASPGYVVHLDQSQRQRLELRRGAYPSAIQYFFSSTTNAAPQNVAFFIGADGTVQVNETALIHGNGTNTLTIMGDRVRPTIDWAMEDRFTGANFLPAHLASARNVPAVIYPSTWAIILDFCKVNPFGVPITEYGWTVVRKGDTTGVYPVRSSTECRNRMEVSALGQYTVNLSVRAADGRIERAFPVDILLKDYLVVSMGDSYSSGEGCPDVPNEDLLLTGSSHNPEDRWTYPAKHLSANSSHAQAALMLERSDPHTSVTFISVAQSGAEVANLIDKPQKPDYSPVTSAPQLNDLAQALCGNAAGCPTAARTIDYLLVGIGGNDAKFGDVLFACGLPNHIPFLGIDISALPSCDSRFRDEWVPPHCSPPPPPPPGPSADPPPSEPVCTGGEFKHVTCRDLLCPTDPPEQGTTPWDGLPVTMPIIFEHLQNDLYPTLNDEIRKRLPLSAATKILIPEYLDAMTGSEDGSLCQSIVFENAICGDARSSDAGCLNGEIDAFEVEWARRGVWEPLNRAVWSTASLGWTPVGGIAAEGPGHAYCSADNFVNTYLQSWLTQEDKFGAMHPNRAGQEMTARHIAAAMGVSSPSVVERPRIAGTGGNGVATCFGPPSPTQPNNSAIVGAGCISDECAQVEVMCKPMPAGVTLGDVQISRQITSDNDGSFNACHVQGAHQCLSQPGVSCGEGVAVGINCAGDNCSAVSMQCRPLVTGHLENCLWTESISDESRWNIFTSGKVANGVRCAGNNCDFMNYFICDTVP
jgi:hypothetical protein